MLKYSFVNLAGKGGCDRAIREELSLADIPEAKLPVGAVASGEVPYSLYGKDYLDGDELIYTRNWGYWVVKGKIPMEVAMEFHLQYGEHDEDVRPMGHGGGFIDGIKLAKWFSNETDIELAKQSEYDKFKDDEDSIIKQYMDETLGEGKYKLSDNFERDGYALVTCYHIDTLLGLKRFADFVRNR